MKPLIIVAFSLLLFGCASQESVLRLQSEIVENRIQIKQLQQQIELLSEQVHRLQSVPASTSATPSSQTPVIEEPKKEESVSAGQCQATTLSGKQCSRTAKEGSKYCWQHQGTTEEMKESSVGSSNRTIMTGPRGGQYYINSKGKKTYIKKK
ncbi:MAG: hypothetical protein HUU02_01660 [Bacteroidetes bacterium]|nr:hypothetical protein [Bacteroidota bacterium]